MATGGVFATQCGRTVDGIYYYSGLREKRSLNEGRGARSTVSRLKSGVDRGGDWRVACFYFGSDSSPHGRDVETADVACLNRVLRGATKGGVIGDLGRSSGKWQRLVQYFGYTRLW